VLQKNKREFATCDHGQQASRLLVAAMEPGQVPRVVALNQTVFCFFRIYFPTAVSLTLYSRRSLHLLYSALLCRGTSRTPPLAFQDSLTHIKARILMAHLYIIMTASFVHIHMFIKVVLPI
jgi:hypothetical protein